MPNELDRILKNAGLGGSVVSEAADEFMDQDARDDQDIADHDARMEREEKIKKMIRNAFKRCGIAISTLRDHPVTYWEDADRLAVVGIGDNDEFSLRLISKLLHTGLSDDFVIFGDDEGLRIEFAVSEALDHAV